MGTKSRGNEIEEEEEFEPEREDVQRRSSNRLP